MMLNINADSIVGVSHYFNDSAFHYFVTVRSPSGQEVPQGLFYDPDALPASIENPEISLRAAKALKLCLSFSH